MTTLHPQTTTFIQVAPEVVGADGALMAEALRLARLAAGRTSPNPMVGAVVAAGGTILGRGYHARAGEAHAEILALREAGDSGRGATLYSTLEPCDHIGRTGACTDAILAAGVRRVVVAMPDPDPKVNGKGLARLQAAGVTVEVGVLEEEARRSNEFYLKHRRTGLPFVCLKWAMSLDGRTAADRTRPTAITGAASRRYVHELRNLYDAVLVGAQTVLTDDPRLTCRLGAGVRPAPRNPLRVVVDSTLRTPPGARIAQDLAAAPTLIATTGAAPAKRVEALRQVGIEVLVQARDAGPVDLRSLLEVLGHRGLLSVLVEGGGTLNASVLQAGLADKIVAFVAPRLLGGRAPRPVEAGWSGDRPLAHVEVRAFGEDLAIEGYLQG